MLDSCRTVYLCAGLTLSSVLLLSPLAQAQTATAEVKYYVVNAGSLDDALNSFARQAGITLTFAPQLVAGKTSPGLQGDYAVEAGITVILGQNALALVNQGGRFYTLNTTETAQTDVIMLGTVNVSANAVKQSGTEATYTEAASVNVITQKQIERFRGTSVGDIFQGTTGVLVSENRNSGGLDVNIRGMQGQGRVPVLVDGARQETTVYRGYSGVSSRSYIDPDLIGNIRIDKGPVMSAGGTGATGGVVSVSTLSAADIIQSDQKSGIRVRGSLTGNNSSAPEPGTYAGYYTPFTKYRTDCDRPVDCSPQYTAPESFAPQDGMDRPGLLEFGGLAGSVAVAHLFDWGELVAAYATRDQGNYYAGKHGPTPYVVKSEPVRSFWYTETTYSREGVSPFRGGERVPNTQFSSDSWLLKGSVLLPSEQSAEFGYIGYSSDFGEMMPSQIRSFGQARQWLDSHVRSNTYTARYRWEPTQYNWADLRFNLWHTDTVTDMNTPAVGSVSLEGNTARRDDYQRYGLDVSNTSRFYQLGFWELEYGIATQWERMTTDTPDNNGLYGGSRSGERDEASGFVTVRWQPTEQWLLSVGTRYTRFHSRDNNPLTIVPGNEQCQPDGAGGCLPVYYRNQYSGSAPIISLTWEPLAGLQFYARYAEALRMPSLFEGTSGWSVSPVQNITLKPEQARNREIGIHYMGRELLTGNDSLNVGIAYFRNHTKDYLTRTQPNAWEMGPGLDLFRMRNIDSADFYGMEVNLEYDAERWFFSASGTRYHHVEICNVGSFVRYYCADWGLPQSYINNMIPPNWHANSTLGLRLFDSTLELGVRATFMGKRNPIPRYNAPTGFNPPVLWHSYQLWDLFVQYQATKNLSLDIAIDNLTDRYYLDALSLGVVPAPGRTARLGITLQF